MNMQERSQKYKGKYKPQNPKKYMGDSDNIIYRSMWERRCMKYFDNNPGILQWASEEIAIPYYDTLSKKVRRYFPDFYIKYKNVHGQVVEKVIEVKPAKQCAPPTTKKRTRKHIYESLEYAKNLAKWKAAEEFCSDRKWEFQVMTEKELGI